MTPDAVRVLIVEDHPLFRRGLRDTLEAEPDLAVAAESSTCGEALGLAREHEPAVALVDVQLPDGSGLTLIRTLAERRPAVPVLILSAYPQRAYAEAAVDLGAAGYLLKDEPAARIVRAVRAVARGGTGWLSEAVRRELREATRDPLTPKETEVVRMLAAGRTPSQVAAVLGVSSRTVRNHLASVYAKLDVHSQPEVVAWAWRNGLAEPR